MEKHAHPPRVVYCAIYSTFLDSQSFEFEICILQALNMPLIRCTNVFFQGRLSQHITSPSEKTRDRVLAWELKTLSMEKHAHPPRVVYSLYTQNLIDSQSFEFEICILQALNMPLYVAPTYFSKGGYPVTPLICCKNVFFQGRLSHQIRIRIRIVYW